MDAQDRVKERLHRAMEGLLREFEADGTQPVDCEFMVTIYGGIIGIGTAMMNSKPEVLTHENFPVDADSSGNGTPDDPIGVIPDIPAGEHTIRVGDVPDVSQTSDGDEQVTISTPVARRRKANQQ